MPWHDVLANWVHLIDDLCAEFRYLEQAALLRFRGDREKLIVYLAETHDLTRAEAEDTLETWLAYFGARIEQPRVA